MGLLPGEEDGEAEGEEEGLPTLPRSLPPPGVACPWSLKKKVSEEGKEGGREEEDGDGEEEEEEEEEEMKGPSRRSSP